MVRQFANEPDGIGQQHRIAIADFDFAREWIERGEQPVFNEDVGIVGHATQDRRLPGIGITDERNTEVRVPPLPLHFTRTLHIREALLENADAMLDEPAVGFQLRFAGTAHTDAAAHLLKVCPHARKTRQQILELRKLHLHACFTRTRPCGENVENEFRAVHHARIDDQLDVLALRWRKLVIENDERGTELLDAMLQLLDLAAPQVCPGMRAVELLRKCPHNLGAGGIGKPRQLLEMLVDEMLGRAPLERRTDENGPFDGLREVDRLATDVTEPA